MTSEFENSLPIEFRNWLPIVAENHQSHHFLSTFWGFFLRFSTIFTLFFATLERSNADPEFWKKHVILGCTPLPAVHGHDPKFDQMFR